jgi:hypothetical protein
MIRIRYRGSNELSPGLHAEAEQRGRRITVYLLSGLTAAQRRSARRRLRLTARMGHCPRLPAGQLAFALLMDRIRTGIGRAGAVLRLHPAGSTVPIMVLSGGAIAFLLFSTVSIHVLHPKPTGDSGAPPVASASAIALGGGPQGQAAGPGGRGGSGSLPGAADPGRVSQGSDTGQLTRPTDAPVTTSPALAAGGGGGVSDGSGSTGSASTGSGSSGTDSGSSSGATTLSGSANQSPVTPQQTTTATSAAAPSPAATAPATTPATSSSGSSSGTSHGACVNVGPVGVCLDL